jgi:aerobic C4-dicarboxylate transport protein
MSGVPPSLDMAASAGPPAGAPAKSSSGRLYLYVLIGMVGGGLLGWYDHKAGESLRPLADGFINLIKMLITPVIFCSVVLGISSMGDLRKLGRVGGKALLYFELVSTVALCIGLAVANLLRPGAGMHADLSQFDHSKIAGLIAQGRNQSVTAHLLEIIPTTFLDAFTAHGTMLQVLLVAILFGVALAGLGERGRAVTAFLESANLALFAVVRLVLRLAPLGAGAAMAFTVGTFGVQALGSLIYLLGCFYLTCLLFILLVLGTIAALTGFSILRFIAYIREEVLTVLATSSSESALLPLMAKLERLGCTRSVVGVVVPTGYSFNLDGTNIYLTLAALFVAQALDIELTLGQQLTLLGVAMLTSKGAAGVTGAGFIALAATLTVVPSMPPEGLVIIYGIDRLMSEARAVTNHIGNGVASLVVSRWEGELDRERLTAELAAGSPQA